VTRIFLHTDSGLALQEIDSTTTVADLAGALGLDEAVGWSENADEPLDETTRVAEAVGDNGHLHLNRCRRIEVTINYAGKAKSHEYTPGTTIGRVRRWAIGEQGYDLPQKERPKHEVGLCGSGVIADRNDHIGTLASDCGLCLDLAPRDRFQG
jgi:hypothetical protein